MQLTNEEKKKYRIELGLRLKEERETNEVLQYLLAALEEKQTRKITQVLFEKGSDHQYSYNALEDFTYLRGYVEGAQELSNIVEAKIKYAEREQVKEWKKG